MSTAPTDTPAAAGTAPPSTNGSAARPIDVVTERLAAKGSPVRNGMARCPAHDDSKPSLSVGEGADGKVLLKCQADCALADVLAALELRLADLFPASQPGDRSRRIVATYPYTDPAGKMLFEVVRYDPKGFLQRRPNGNGGWVWKLDGVERVLYRLPEIIAAVAAGERVYVVEGEKDADALHAAGCHATTSPQGAGKWGKVADHACLVLANADVVVVQDNDKVGRAHAAEVVASLEPVVASLQHRAPAGKFKDVAEHLGAGRAVDELVDAAVPTTGEILRRGDDESTPASAAWTLGNESEAHVAEALASWLRGRYLWSAKLGWLRWDGQRWRRDENERVLEDIRQWVIEVAKAMVATASLKELERAASYKTAGRINALATLARRMAGIAVEPDQLDDQPGLLNCANGVVDLRTGELGPHDPALLFTKVAGADFHPDARHPDVDAAVSALDADVADYVGAFLGYSASGEASEDVVHVWDGSGSNGKTTLLTAASAALGDFARPIARELILRTGREEHPTAYAELHRLRLGFLEELPEDGVLRVEVIKALSGGGEVRARYMHKDAWAFQMTHALVVATNHRPRVFTNEHAVWRRLRLVPFPHRYADAEDKALPGDRLKDPRLRSRLARGASQRAAMLAWIVAGARRWYDAGGFTTPAEVTAATATWRASADALASFLADRLVPDLRGYVKAGRLYEAYKEWATAEGSAPFSNRRFAEAFVVHPAVVAHGVAREEQSAGRIYRGLDWRLPGADPHDWTLSVELAEIPGQHLFVEGVEDHEKTF